MEPLDPETKARILQDNPQAAPDDIEEYERLLSEQFTVDPDMPKAPEDISAETGREARLRELYIKLFLNRPRPRVSPRP